MDSKLQELTEKLRVEGVEKGKSEASEIINKAKAEADEIRNNAKAEAQKIVEEAQTEAAEIDRKTKSELKLFAGQAVNALKSEITDMVCNTIVNESVANATADPKFMQGIMAKLAEAWVDGNAVIETSDAKALEEYFVANAKALLDKGLVIKEVKGLKTNFTIAPENGGYKINCGDEEFKAYFKEFIRAKLLDLLF